MGRDNTPSKVEISDYKFQSTRPHGARLGGCVKLLNLASFNPRARMGRDSCNPCAVGCMVVSIHAPAWGATG